MKIYEKSLLYDLKVKDSEKVQKAVCLISLAWVILTKFLRQRNLANRNNFYIPTTYLRGKILNDVGRSS